MGEHGVLGGHVVPVGTMRVTLVRQLIIKELMRLLREAARRTQESIEGRWAEELGTEEEG